jgi:hypothetical protein
MACQTPQFKINYLLPKVEVRWDTGNGAMKGWTMHVPWPRPAPVA